MPEWLVASLVAPFVGSFLGLVALRLPEGRAVVVSRSRCPHCGRVLGPVDLIPLVGWLLGRGHCRHCKAALGVFYPAIEIAAIAVALWAASQMSGWLLWASCGFGWALLALAAIDLRNMILPDVLTLPLIPLGLVVAYVAVPERIADHAIGALAGFAALAGIRWAYQRLRHREGLGFGDVKLCAAIGAWLSWVGLPSAILIGALAGTLWVLGTARAAPGLSPTREVPFGAFLALGSWVVWLHGPILLL